MYEGSPEWVQGAAHRALDRRPPYCPLLTPICLGQDADLPYPQGVEA
jgi:hypothetical protein